MSIVNVLVRGFKKHLSLASCICNSMSGIMSRRPISDKAAFKDVLKRANRVAALTGAGVSAESGVPTFRGEGGLWRKYVAQQLATPEAFTRDPSLVWEFYHYRRELVLTKMPNKAHIALADFERRLKAEGRSFVLVTQNIDGLHQTAGSQEVVELHGSLFKTRCLKCGDVAENRDSPICPALKGMGAPDPDAKEVRIATEDLPRCKKASCGGLLRPHVVWFGEALDVDVLQKAGKALEECDLCLVIGTSSVVYPAAMFAPQVAARGVPVAEFNIEITPATNEFMSMWNYSSGGVGPVKNHRKCHNYKSNIICWELEIKMVKVVYNCARKLLPKCFQIATSNKTAKYQSSLCSRWPATAALEDSVQVC